MRGSFLKVRKILDTTERSHSGKHYAEPKKLNSFIGILRWNLMLHDTMKKEISIERTKTI